MHQVPAQTPLPVNDEVAFRPPSHDEELRNDRLILVAEDNETIQKLIVRQLALFGCAADVASNGSVALERWKTGHYALLLSDLHMPEMDGYALAAAIRAQERGSRRIPIIALTADAIEEEAEHRRMAGMDDCLSKPLRLADLKAVMETWLPAAASSYCRAEPQAVTPVDVSVLESSIGNDLTVLHEFLDDFQSGAAKIHLDLKTACTSRQPVQVSAQAHKLKSSARAVGALALGDLCAAMEIAGQAGSNETLAVLLPLLEQQLDAVNASLDSLPARRANRRNDE